MSVRVIVAAAGPQHKWGEYLGVPSHLAPVHGKPLLYRTLRQALSISDDVHVTYPGDDRYLEAVPLGVAAHLRQVTVPSEYRATQDLWNPEGRTILLLGDVYFTDEAIAKIRSFAGRRFQSFGRRGASRITGCKYGELYAASWYPEHHNKIDEHLVVIEEHHRNKTITRPTGWMLLRAFQGTLLNKHVCHDERFPNHQWMTTIDDATEDWDFPVDYHRHPVNKKAVTRTMRAGDGHAARNKQLPELLRNLSVEPRHVVHLGAHDGEEMPFYEAAGFKKITLVEPIPEKASELRRRFPEADVIEAAVGATPGVQQLFVMARTNMTTLVESKERPARTIDVEVVRLDDIALDANVAVVDVQGLELEVLQSGDLSRFDIVMVETSTVPDATMASTFDEVTEHMELSGFEVYEYWTRDYQWVANWGRRKRPSAKGEIRDVVYVQRRATVGDETAAPAGEWVFDHESLTTSDILNQMIDDPAATGVYHPETHEVVGLSEAAQLLADEYRANSGLKDPMDNPDMVALIGVFGEHETPADADTDGAVVEVKATTGAKKPRRKKTPTADAE